MKVIVLGCGLVGKPMAADLAGDSRFQVTVADINEKQLASLKDSGPIDTLAADLSDPDTVKQLVSPYDIVLDAVPGHLGYQTFKAVIEAGKNVVDIAFFPEDPFGLDQLAKENKVTAIMDMGVAPGMSNLLVGYADHLLDKTTRAVIYVGGLPCIRRKPYEYKAVFSSIDVIEEYTRPARFVRNGQAVTMPALSEAELLDFEGIGTLEAFNSDGLRSLFYTISCPDMIEKTLRYPGHIGLMTVLRDSGFFSKEEIEIRGTKIRPVDLTTSLLFPAWKLEEGEKDLTVMKIMVEGFSSGKHLRYSFDLLDYYDAPTRVHSMARTTGYTATAAVRMLAGNLFNLKGVIVPEYIGKYPQCVSFLLEELKNRGVVYHQLVEEV
ncbi:MAG: saccharopine dehydrogenase NADP-binding domain-containing protein [Bacteroidetes bacterium]|nr:saccharopine dehydrogenase NADP-binding domain-containing protein [Bacteroidota bacterium]